jgi:hypothetical protein
VSTESREKEVLLACPRSRKLAHHSSYTTLLEQHSRAPSDQRDSPPSWASIDSNPARLIDCLQKCGRSQQITLATAI